MERLLERLDSFTGTLVPLLYLLGLALGAAAYFSGLTLDAGIAVGIGLACATELHSFLQQRRLRATFGAFRREAPGSPEREKLTGQLWTDGAILAALLAFSTYNSIAFVAETWHPAPGFLPAPVQIAIRGSVIPAFFFLAGFLVPLALDASALLSSAAHGMLHTTIKATVKQWKRRVRRARRRGIDLAPVAIALMEDAGDTDGARRIQMIASGLDTAEAAMTRQRIGRGIPLQIGPAHSPAIAPTSTLALASLANPASIPDLGADLGDMGSTDTPDDDNTPPTGGPGSRGGPRGRRSAGGSIGASAGTSAGNARPRSTRPATLALVPDHQRQHSRRDSGMTRAEQEALWNRDVALARDILNAAHQEGEEISIRELARRLSVGRAHTCHPGRAATVRRHITSAANIMRTTRHTTERTTRQEGAQQAQERQGHRRASNE